MIDFDNQVSNIRVWPNPTSGELEVLVPDLHDQEIEITLTGIQGQVLNRNTFDTDQNLIRLSLSDINPGSYILIVESPVGRHIQMITVIE